MGGVEFEMRGRAAGMGLRAKRGAAPAPQNSVMEQKCRERYVEDSPPCRSRQLQQRCVCAHTLATALRPAAAQAARHGKQGSELTWARPHPSHRASLRQGRGCCRAGCVWVTKGGHERLQLLCPCRLESTRTAATHGAHAPGWLLAQFQRPNFLPAPHAGAHQRGVGVAAPNAPLHGCPYLAVQPLTEPHPPSQRASCLPGQGWSQEG